MEDSSESDNQKNENESQIFEENNLYISGKVFKQSLSKINSEFEELSNLFKKEEFQSFDINEELSIDDIKINSLEDDVENIIKSTINSVSNHKNNNKKIFILKSEKKEKEENNINKSNNEIINTNKEEEINNEKDMNNNTDDNNNNKKKVNYLRNEAKILEETISKLNLTDYQTLKKEKFKNCNLNSLIFFKNCKKEIGKENNYIFNYRDNFLNDMTKIDQLFFQDYFKPNLSYNSSQSLNLIYDFSIYHPLNNVKTQQISIIGDGVLKQLKQKIYCVLDEIRNEEEIPSFFFLEKVFYDDYIFPNGKYLEPLSHKISQLKLQKLTFKEYKEELNYGNNDIYNNKNIESKFSFYEKSLYCTNKELMFNKSHSYESLNMSNIQIEDIPLRIGYPYIFRHSDYCDHVIILNDIRVMDKYDNFREKDEKAVVTYQKKLKRKKCDACQFYYAKFISINDIVKGNVNNALFLCDYCLKKLHETELVDNNTSNLKLIPYFHN